MNDDEWNKRVAEARAAADTPTSRAAAELAIKLGEWIRSFANRATPNERRAMAHALVSEDDLVKLDALNKIVHLARIDELDAIDRVVAVTRWERPHAVAVLSKWYGRERERLKAEREAREAARAAVHPDRELCGEPWSDGGHPKCTREKGHSGSHEATSELGHHYWTGALAMTKCGPRCRCGIDRGCPGWSLVN